MDRVVLAQGSPSPHGRNPRLPQDSVLSGSVAGLPLCAPPFLKVQGSFHFQEGYLKDVHGVEKTLLGTCCGLALGWVPSLPVARWHQVHNNNNSRCGIPCATSVGQAY